MSSPSSILGEIIDIVVERCIPRIVAIRSSMARLVLEPSTANLIGMLSYMRSAEASHIEELGVKLSEKLEDTIDVFLDIASDPPIEEDELVEDFTELLSLGIPPSIASEILYVLTPSIAPLIDGIAVAGAKKLGFDISIPCTGDEYRKVLDTLSELENTIDGLRVILLIPTYIAIDAVLQLAYEDRMDRDKLRELRYLGKKLRLIERIGLIEFFDI